MTTKKNLGQFMTTNHEYILQGFEIPDNTKHIIEPFCGQGDLVINLVDKYEIECYDIEPKDVEANIHINKRDTIGNPPDYSNKFIITNPPYLARNKCDDKRYFDQYNVNDLFKCLIKELISNIPDGGILIVPLNFWSSIREADINLRKNFLNVFKIIKINIFNEQVFKDTSYTVCSFMFIKKVQDECNTTIDINIYPTHKHIDISLTSKNNYMIGGEIYNLTVSKKYAVDRITSKNIKNANTNLLIKCIDDNTKINLSFVDDKKIYIDNTPNQSARTYASFIINPVIDSDKQKKLVYYFNKFLNSKRDKYDSLFMANYRESNSIMARKRISFDLVYKIIKYVLEKMDGQEIKIGFEKINI